MLGNLQPGRWGTHTESSLRGAWVHLPLFQARPQTRGGRCIAAGLMGLVALASATPCAAVPDHCFSDAASRYGLDASLLRAVAKAESDMDPLAVNGSHFARTRSRDIGVMQINTSWLPQLAGFGIRQEHLFDACTNVAIGAWILASEFARRGPTWDAVGAYNAACSQLKGNACQAARSRYAWRVYKKLVAAQSPKPSPGQSGGQRGEWVGRQSALEAAAQPADTSAPLLLAANAQRPNLRAGLISVAARGRANDASQDSQEARP